MLEQRAALCSRLILKAALANEKVFIDPHQSLTGSKPYIRHGVLEDDQKSRTKGFKEQQLKNKNSILIKLYGCKLNPI